MAFSAKDYLESGKDQSPLAGEDVLRVPAEQIEPNPFQPRKTYGQHAMLELTNSIREKGVLEPVLLRLNPNAESPYRYQLAAGERRLRASKAAGLTHIPGIVRELSDMDMRDVGLIENVQREDLYPYDTMNAYADLREVHGSAEAIADRTGKHKRTIEKYLKIHSEITSVPEAVEVFAKHAGTVEYVTLSAFAGVAPQLRRLAKADKREFARAIKALAKDPKAGVQRLVKKFDPTDSEKGLARHEIFTETDKELILSVRVNKASVGAVQEIKAKIDAFCARLDSLCVTGKEEE